MIGVKGIKIRSSGVADIRGRPIEFAETGFMIISFREISAARFTV